MADVIPEQLIDLELSEKEVDAIKWAIDHAKAGSAAAVAIDRIALIATGMPLSEVPEGTMVDLRRVRIERSIWKELSQAVSDRDGPQSAYVWMNKGPSGRRPRR